MSNDDSSPAVDSAGSSQTSFLVLNYLITAIWLLGLLALASRSSTQVSNETLILGKWSVAFTAVLGLWSLGGLIHLFLFTRTAIGKKIFSTNVLVTVISTVVFLLIAEFAARGLDLFPDNALISTTEATDPILGTRYKSNVIGHDENGWRNVTVPEDVDWLFLGDSMTYGSGVSREEAFALLSGEISGRKTYNLSHGGFGPAEYLHMYREFGAELSPEIVIVGITLANDIMDVTAARADRWDGLGIDTSSVIVDVDDPTNVRNSFTQYLSTSAIAPGFMDRLMTGVQQRINQHSAIGRAFIDPPSRDERQPAWYESANALAVTKTAALAPEFQWFGIDPPYMIYSDDLVSTVFTPTRRLFPVKLTFPTILASVDVTNDILRTLAEEVEADGGQLVMAIIPTKEEVFFQYLQDRNVELTETFLDLMSNTAIIKSGLNDFAGELGVCVLDTTPALSEAASQGLPIYFLDSDGHPAAPGHQVMAEYLTGEISRLEQGEACR